MIYRLQANYTKLRIVLKWKEIKHSLWLKFILPNVPGALWFHGFLIPYGFYIHVDFTKFSWQKFLFQFQLNVC